MSNFTRRINPKDEFRLLGVELMEKKDAMISVIVPVYNAEKYINKCIESITNQTYRDLEVILVDDGSTDNSAYICDEYAKKDERIRVIHKENEGQAKARNLALGMVRGKYIGFVDSDDWIEPEMYGSLLSAIDGHDIAMCGRYNVDEDTGERSILFCNDEPFVMSKKEAIRRFLTYDKIDAAGWDKLFRKEILEDLEYPSGYICEDIPFIYNALKRCNSVIHTGKPMYNYLQRSGSTSHSSFSKKTEGLIRYPLDIKNDICVAIPELKNEAEYYFHKNYFFYVQIFADSNYPAKGIISIAFSDIFYSGYTKREKIKLLLTKFHLYSFVKKIWFHISWGKCCPDEKKIK